MNLLHHRPHLRPLRVAAAMVALAVPAGAADPGPGGDSGLSLVLSYERMSLDFSLDAATEPLGLTSYEDLVEGGELTIGYRFGRQLRVDMSVFGAELDVLPEDARMVYGGVRVGVAVPLVHWPVITPELLGGVGFGVFEVDVPGSGGPDGEDERVLVMVRGDLGLGLRARIAGPLSIEGQLLYVTHDLDYEARSDGNEIDPAGGTAWTRVARAGIVIDF